MNTPAREATASQCSRSYGSEAPPNLHLSPATLSGFLRGGGATFVRAWLAEDEDTAGALLDAVAGSKWATANLLAQLMELARYAVAVDPVIVSDLGELLELLDERAVAA